MKGNKTKKEKYIVEVEYKYTDKNVEKIITDFLTKKYIERYS